MNEKQGHVASHLLRGGPLAQSVGKTEAVSCVCFLRLLSEDVGARSPWQFFGWKRRSWARDMRLLAEGLEFLAASASASFGSAAELGGGLRAVWHGAEEEAINRVASY